MVLLNSSFSCFVDLYDNLQESSDTREVRKNRSSEFVIPTGHSHSFDGQEQMYLGVDVSHHLFFGEYMQVGRYGVMCLDCRQEKRKVTRYTPPRKSFRGLPAHKLLSQSSKLDPTQTFCKEVAELVVGTNMDQLDPTRTDMLAEPVILYCIVFLPWRHSARFQLAKCQGTNVIFMNFYMHIRCFFYHHVHLENRAYLFCQIN